MGYYDIMQVCRKWGHKITDVYANPQFRQNFCEKCGSKTIHQCEHCDADIPGYYHSNVVVIGEGPAVPLNCHNCGAPYPWRNRLFIGRLGRSIASPAKYIFDRALNLLTGK